MPIWTLEPVDLTSEHWSTSTHKGTAIVRAADERRARSVATTAFIIAADVTLSSNTLFTPWAQPEHVACSRLEGSEFPESGPEEVLDPPQYE
jgi:hypothetical protein